MQSAMPDQSILHRHSVTNVVEPLEPRRLLSAAPQSVLTYHNDNTRSGANLAETTLTPANVNASTFGLAWSFPVDGQIYGQPLVAAAVRVGAGRRPRTAICSWWRRRMTACTPSTPTTRATAGWCGKTRFFNYKKHIVPVPVVDVIADDISPVVGITSTPVIDPATNTIYVVTKTVQGGLKDAGTYVQKLHAIDLSTGAEKFGGPVAITPRAVRHRRRRDVTATSPSRPAGRTSGRA